MTCLQFVCKKFIAKLGTPGKKHYLLAEQY